jgi:hypothetical protein
VGDLDVFTFAADAGDNIFVGMSRINSSISPQVNVYRPDGVLLGSNVGTFAASVEAAAPIGGTYTAIVRDANADNEGGYAVSLAIGPQVTGADPFDNDGGTLTSGQTAFGYVTAGDTDVFTFTQSAGAPFTVRMARLNSGINPSLLVYAPDGTRFADAGTFEANVTVASAPVAGTYTVVAADSGVDNAGGYAIALGGGAPSATDTRAPVALVGQLEHLRTGLVQVAFSEAMQGLVGTNLMLNNTTTGANFVGTSVSFDAATNLATYTVAGGLPDGNYNATLAVGNARDLANNPLAGSFNFSFFVLRGDANRNRSVNVIDFSTLAANFNRVGTFGEGDFNYDGMVTVLDFSILGSRFNTGLITPRFGAPPQAANPFATFEIARNLWEEINVNPG